MVTTKEYKGDENIPIRAWFLVHPLATGLVPSIVGDHVVVRYAPGAYEVAILGIEPASPYPKTSLVPLDQKIPMPHFPFSFFPHPVFCSASKKKERSFGRFNIVIRDIWSRCHTLVSGYCA